MCSRIPNIEDSTRETWDLFALRKHVIFILFIFSVFSNFSLLFCQNNVIGEYSEFVNTYDEQIINITQQISEFV